MSKKIPIWTNKAFSKEKRDKISKPIGKQIKEDNKKFGSVPSKSGLLNTEGSEPIINFISAPDDVVVGKKRGGAQIVFGKDRPSTQVSGYGGKGAQKSNAIDIVAGRISCDDEAKDGTWAHPNFACDAARIYISQKTNMDINFGIPIGKDPVDTKGSSGIAVKADTVRIIGRQGVKIVSGPSMQFLNSGPDGERLSNGGINNQKAPPIQLMAGYSDDLQPIPRGDNLRSAFMNYNQIILALSDAVFKVALLQLAYNSINSISHTQPWLAAYNVTNVEGYLKHALSATEQIMTQLTTWENTHITVGGPEYILSTNVFTT